MSVHLTCRMLVLQYVCIQILKDAPCVKTVIMIGKESSEIEGVKTECVEKLIENGKKGENDPELGKATSDDIAVIMVSPSKLCLCVF